MLKLEKFSSQDLCQLSDEEYKNIFDWIIERKFDDDQIKQFLLNLNQANLPSNAFIGAVNSFKPKCKSSISFPDALDVCGTGGDKLSTLNISTAVAFVLAACGLKVAKHGNKAVSSKSGSADILLELGVNIVSSQLEIKRSLEESGLCFMFAPLYHPSFKALTEIRSNLSVPTIFNFLGPLLNPANAKYQLIGTSKKETMLPMLQTLKSTGSNEVFIVHGLDGMDEITISDNSLLIKLNNGKITQEDIINPEFYGIKKVPIDKICGGNAKYNAKRIVSLLNGEQSAYLDIVILNCAFALLLKNKVFSIVEGIEIAKKAIKSGKAKKILEKLSDKI